MKRFVSVDFLRGLAIILMIALHVFIKTWNTDILLELVAEGNGFMAIIAIIIVYFASFAGLFIAVSAMGNLFSMNSQYLKLKEITPNAARIIRKNQLIRGAIMFFMGFFVTVFLWQYIFRIPIAFLINDPFTDYWKQWMYDIWWIDIITFMGMATMIVGTVYTHLLEKGKSIPEIRKILGWIAVIILIISPFILTAVRSIYLEESVFWNRPGRGVENRSFGTNVIYFIMTLIGGNNQGLFSWLAISFIGTIMALDLVEKPVTKEFKKKWVKIGLILLFLGLILQVINGLIADTLDEPMKTIFENGFGKPLDAGGTAAYRMFIDGGELICMALLIYWVEGNNRAKKFAKRTVAFRRAGLISLTLYSIQYLALIPIVLIESYIFHYPLADEYQATLGQSMLAVVLISLLFLAIPGVWEKIQFKGTFEWIIARILSRGNKDAMDRLNVQGTLYDVEPLGEPGVIKENTESDSGK
jgi:hypothetical protein